MERDLCGGREGYGREMHGGERRKKGNSDEGEEEEGCGTLTCRWEIEGGRRACQNVGTMSEIAF